MESLYNYMHVDRKEDLTRYFLKFKIIVNGMYDFYTCKQEHNAKTYTEEQYQLKYSGQVIAYYEEQELKLTDNALNVDIFNKMVETDVINKLNDYMKKAYMDGIKKCKLKLFGKYLALEKSKNSLKEDIVFKDGYIFDYATLKRLEKRLTEWFGGYITEEQLPVIEKLIQVEELEDYND